MTQWPPTNLVATDGTPATTSWLFCPLLADAVGEAHLFSFPRPPYWAQWVAIVQAALQAAGINIMSWYLNCDDPSMTTHLSAATQNAWMALTPPIFHAALAQWAHDVAMGNMELLQDGLPLADIDGLEDFDLS